MDGDDVIIIGGGIHGASVAYYLSQQAKKPGSITIIERHGIAAAASGKAGGFLARDWGSDSTVELHEKGFDLHCELADKFKLASFRKGLQVLSVNGNNCLNSKRSNRRSDLAPWLDGNLASVEKLSSGAAQVTPAELTHRFVEESKCNVIISIAEGVELDDDNNFCGIRTSSHGTINGNKLVLAAGPWTSVLISDWFGLSCPMEGIKSTSMIYNTLDKAILDYPYAVFCEEDIQFATHLELYPRPNGDLYVCGCGGSDHISGDRLRKGGDSYDPADILANEARIEASEQALHKMTSIVDGIEPLVIQACMRPCPQDGIPIMGKVAPESINGVYISCGHNCWGILWAPICGKAIAALVTNDRQDHLDLSLFSLNRFNQELHKRQRGRKKGAKDAGEEW